MVLRAAAQLIDDRLAPDARLWGMKLYFTSRFVRATPSTPNLFQTTNAVHGLLDAYQVTGDRGYAETAAAAIDACETVLGFVATPDGLYSRYYPGMMPAVYNVNALLAAACWRIASLAIGDSDRQASRADRILHFVLAGQRADGSWPYAADPSGQWVDGFHTGYVLESLGYFLHSPFERVIEVPLRAGLAYFTRKLIDRDGCPKYFDRARYPIDVQNCAQAIQMLARLLPQVDDGPRRLEAVLNCTAKQLLVTLKGGRAYFAASRRPWLFNKTAYVRWGQAPMVLALTHAWNAKRDGPGYFGGEGVADRLSLCDWPGRGPDGRRD